MMSARTSFLVWWGLPILCAGLGALAAIYAGSGSAFGFGPRRGALLLVAGYFVLVGLLAVIFRVRQSQVTFDDRQRFDKPVEAAMVAMCAPILLAGLWVAATSFVADFGPTQTIAGKIESVDQVGAFGRSFAIDLDRTARPLILECPLDRRCGSPVSLMQLKVGSPAELRILNGDVIGVRSADRQLVDPGSQRSLRLVFGGAALLLLIGYSAAFVGVSMRLLFGAPEDEE